MPSRGIVVNGRPLAEGRLPAICAPLVAAGDEALVAEARAVVAKQPDLLEWRVDFFEGIADTPRVLRMARTLQELAGDIPVLFTRRSQREGGQPIALDEVGVAALCEAVCAEGVAQLLDYEMDSDPAHVARMREATRAGGVQLVLSFHDFQATPSAQALAARFAKARDLGADIAKVAVMPTSMQDVHRLLGATLEASECLGIPVISMAMGPLGAVSRLCGGVFGSALTFAVGAAASAPGQMPIEDVRAGVEILRRAA